MGMRAFLLGSGVGGLLYWHMSQRKSLFVCLSLSLSLTLSLSLCVCLSVSVCLYLSLSVSLPISICLFLSMPLSCLTLSGGGLMRQFQIVPCFGSAMSSLIMSCRVVPCLFLSCLLVSCASKYTSISLVCRVLSSCLVLSDRLIYCLSSSSFLLSYSICLRRCVSNYKTTQGARQDKTRLNSTKFN
jgi:hypothetical protein